MRREPGIVGRSDEIGILGQTFDRLMDENAMREDQRATAEERREIWFTNSRIASRTLSPPFNRSHR